jgi:hypothetical protein
MSFFIPHPSFVRAKQIIDERLETQPNSSVGNTEIKELLKNITRKNISSEVEGINIPDEPFRMLVTYKNTDTLYGRVLSQKDVDRMTEKKNALGDQYWKKITNLPPIRNFNQPLPLTNDFQTHSCMHRSFQHIVKP